MLEKNPLFVIARYFFDQTDIVHVPNALGISGWSDKSYSVTGFRTASGEPYVVFDAKVGHAEKLVDFVKEYHKHLSHQKMCSAH